MKRFIDDFHGLVFDYSVENAYDDGSIHVNIVLLPESELLYGGDEFYTAHYCATIIGNNLGKLVRSFNDGHYKHINGTTIK